MDRGGDDTQLGLDANIFYELTPKSRLTFGANNDFGTSPQGQQQKNFSLNGGISSQISEEWTVNAGLNFRATDYGTRTDDYVELNLGASYIVNANIRILGGYTYRSYASDIASAEFKNNVFSISANFRY